MTRPNTKRVITYYVLPPTVPTLPVLPSLTVCVGGPGKCMGAIAPIDGADHGAACNRHAPEDIVAQIANRRAFGLMPTRKQRTLLADHTRRFPRGESCPSERQHRVNRCDRDEDGDSTFCAGPVEVYSVRGAGARVLCATHADAAVDYATVVAAFTSTSADYAQPVS